MLFFSEKISTLNKAYANLFGIADDGDKVEGEGPDDEGENEGDKPEDGGISNTFGKRWGWVFMIHQVSDVTKMTWHQVLSMQVTEFLNINCYIRDKNNYEKAQMEKWRKSH